MPPAPTCRVRRSATKLWPLGSPPSAQRAPTSCSARAFKRAASWGSDPISRTKVSRCAYVCRSNATTHRNLKEADAPQPPSRGSLSSPTRTGTNPISSMQDRIFNTTCRGYNPSPSTEKHSPLSDSKGHHHQGRPRDKAQPSKPTSPTMTTMRATPIAPYNFINLLLLHHHHHH